MAGARTEGAAAAISRIAAAVIGGLCFASAVIIALPAVLPGSKLQWVIGGGMLGFALWTGAAIWAFGARSALGAWAGLALGTAIAVAALWLGGELPR